MGTPQQTKKFLHKVHNVCITQHYHKILLSAIKLHGTLTSCHILLHLKYLCTNVFMYLTLDAKVLFCVTLKCLALFEEGVQCPLPLHKWVYPPEEGSSKLDGEKVTFEAPTTLKIYFPAHLILFLVW